MVWIDLNAIIRFDWGKTLENVQRQPSNHSCSIIHVHFPNKKCGSAHDFWHHPVIDMNNPSTCSGLHIWVLLSHWSLASLMTHVQFCLLAWNPVAGYTFFIQSDTALLRCFSKYNLCLLVIKSKDSSGTTIKCWHLTFPQITNTFRFVQVIGYVLQWHFYKISKSYRVHMTCLGPDSRVWRWRRW